MQNTVTKMKKFLSALSIDTQYEQGLLESLFSQTERETILVVGDVDGAPCTLLPLKEQLFKPGEVPGFPLIAEYADAFSIHAVNEKGEAEQYKTISDFRYFCAGRLDTLRRCTVRIPCAFLKQNRLVYLQFGGNMNALSEAAKGCTGCILVMAADAGGLSDDYMSLCHWLAEERCIAGRTNLILNCRSPFGNRMLPFMVESQLKRKKLAVFKCGIGGQGVLTVARALEAALLDIQERSGDGTEKDVLFVCLEHVESKLNHEVRLLQEQREKKSELARQYENAGELFQAMCTTEQYSLASILSKEGLETLRSEIHGMFDLLRNRFPKMVEEVMDKSRKPKEDLKNLAGDYLSALTDSFMDSLLGEVADKLLIPQTRQHFTGVCERFRRMMQEVELEYETLEEHVKTEFLRMAEINLGDFYPTIAQAVSNVLTTAIQVLLAGEFEGWGLVIAGWLNEELNRFFADAVATVMTKKQYANSLCSHVQKQLDEHEEKICQQLQGTILPRLMDMLRKEFEKLTRLYSDQIQERFVQYESEKNGIHQSIQQLEDQLAELKKMRTNLAKQVK